MNLAQDIQENPTIFGKIIRDEVPREVVYEDDQILAFRNIVAPEAKVHVLVIPKKRFESIQNVEPQDAALMGHLMAKIPEIAMIAGVHESGYRIISNSGPDSCQEVPHLHFHILGGEKLHSKL